jgi:hypothetical protein
MLSPNSFDRFEVRVDSLKDHDKLAKAGFYFNQKLVLIHIALVSQNSLDKTGE